MTLSALKALFIKDFKTSVRELEFVLYILGPLVAAGVLKLAGGFIDAAALPTEHIAVSAAPADAAIVNALNAHPRLVVEAEVPWAEAQALVKEGEVSTAVHIPEGALAALGGDPPPKLEQYNASNTDTAAGSVRQALSQTLDALAKRPVTAQIEISFATGDEQPFSLSGIFLETSLILALLFGGLYIVPLGWSSERESGQVEALMLAGISASTALTAKALFGGALTAGAGLGVVLIAYGPGALLPTLPHLLIGATALVALGLAASMLAKTRKQAELILAGLMTVISVPALGAKSSTLMAAVSDWLPAGPLVEGLKASATGIGQPPSAWAFELAVLSVYAVVGIAFSAWRVRQPVV